MSSDWRCDRHGPVLPLQSPLPPTRAGADRVLAGSAVPVWVVWPLPPGWLVTGFAVAGDDRQGGRASVVALSGPAPLGGTADLLVVAEEPGVGLGARYAGIAGPDPGSVSDLGPPQARVQAAGHEAPLWAVAAPPDRAAYAGEARGLWLWLVAWPDIAAMVVLDRLELVDLRDVPALDLPFGAPSPRLR
jgi:hypothetical protein